jgi:hypothetical protein
MPDADLSMALDGVLREMALADPFDGLCKGEDDPCATTTFHVFVDSTNDEDLTWQPSPTASSRARKGLSADSFCLPSPDSHGCPSYEAATAPLDALCQNSLISSLLHEPVNDLAGSRHSWDTGPLSCAKGGGCGATSKNSPKDLQLVIQKDKLALRLLHRLRDLRGSPLRGRHKTGTGRVPFLLPPSLSDWKVPDLRAREGRIAPQQGRQEPLPAGLSTTNGLLNSNATDTPTSLRTNGLLNSNATDTPSSLRTPRMPANGRRASTGCLVISSSSLVSGLEETGDSTSRRRRRSVRFLPEPTTVKRSVRNPSRLLPSSPALMSQNSRFGPSSVQGPAAGRVGGAGDRSKCGGTVDKAPKRPQRRNSFAGGGGGTG